MNFDPNDPKWTAYILDEPSLSAVDRAEMDKRLDTDPELRKFTEELKNSAKQFSECLSLEPKLLNADAPSLVAAVCGEMEKPRRKRWASVGTIAACSVAVCAVAVVSMQLLPPKWEKRTAAVEMKVASEKTEGKPGLADLKVSDVLAFGTVDKAEGGDNVRSRERNDYMRAEPKIKQLTTLSAESKGDAKPDVDAPKVLIDRLAESETHFYRLTPGSTRAEQEVLARLASVTAGRNYVAEDKLTAGTNGVKPADSKFAANKLEATRELGEQIAVDWRMRVAGLQDDAGVKADLGGNTEAYPVFTENEFLTVNALNALSTFSTDVDTASYANVRRFLTQNHLPPPGAVRIEEMVNYFPYAYPPPIGDAPFAVHLETAECPWNPQHRLARIALKGREIALDNRPKSNLVFLLDVSGSMDEPNKLPLVKESMKLLVNQLTENDRVAIAVYAGVSGLVLDSTRGDKKSDILYAIDNLQPSGSTNGAAGIKVAYEAAVKGFVKGGVNRVILCTDGDFNVGVSSDDELVKLIQEKAKTGVFLSVLGFGAGNYKDAKMMHIADKGNGNYAYIDSKKEGRKVLVEQMTGTLITIAKDVKIQVEFNPAKVSAYRLVGYEKRALKAEDFKDDKKDAGEIGAGHTVTALYEIVPADLSSPAQKTDALVFQKPAAPVKDEELAGMSFLVKLRYKLPDGAVSTEVRFPGVDQGRKYTQATADFQFAAAVASFGQLIRDSKFKGNASFASVAELAASAKANDVSGYRAEFITLIQKAAELKK